MPLPLPKLDTLRYDTLVSEARDVLPYRAPDWTDYNAHDPGITLLELFAWITENNSYRLDRVTAGSELAFLRLMGFAPERARTALAVVTLQPIAAAGAVVLPANIQIANADFGLRFQTGMGLGLVAAQLTNVLSATSGGWTDFSAVNALLHSTFLPFGETPREGDAVYFGFDAPLDPAGERVGMFVFGDDLARDYEIWRRRIEDYRRSRRIDRRTCARPSGTAGLWSHYGVTVTWEYFDGTNWRGLERVRDATRALSTSGPVRFQAPGAAAHQAGGVPGVLNRWFIRCRVARGEYDCPPRIRGGRINAVLARHAADNASTDLDSGTGHASQRFFVSPGPIVPGSTRLAVDAGGNIQTDWTERPDVARSGPHDRHYIVDAAHGNIVFGDGRHGAVPPAGAKMSIGWQTGSGAGGNVSAATLRDLPSIGAASTIAGWAGIRAAIRVDQPLAAFGGVDAESLPAAKARAVQLLTELRCAVTLEDFERLARAVPGVPVARARAVAEFHPRYECLPVAGCITVVVMTNCARRRPQPSEALCRAVQRYLDRRRPVAVEIHVTGPEWTRVTVRAGLRLRAGVDAAAIRSEARRRLDAFLDPLTGGADGQGWPIGGSIYRSEIYAVLQDIAGVHSIDPLALQSGDLQPDLCNNLELCPHGMPVSGAHEINAAPGRVS